MRYKYLTVIANIYNYSISRFFTATIALLLSTLSLSLFSQNVIPDSLLFSQISQKSETSQTYTSSSVLSTGSWIRVSSPQAGIYKLSHEDLNKMGLPVSGIPSSSIHIHGYGGLLPEISAAKRFDDIPEIAINVIDGGDGRFDPGDYLLYYSPGPHGWRYNVAAGAYDYIENIYSDFAYYFITVNNKPGLRVNNYQLQGQATSQVNYYDHRDAYNPEQVNLIKSGRNWFGDVYDIITSRDYNFNSVQLKPDSELKLRFSAAARSFTGCTFNLIVNGVTHSLPIQPVLSDFNTNYAFMSTVRFSQNAPATFNSARVTFSKFSGMDIGYLNFIEVNAQARLVWSGKQFTFRKNDLSGLNEFVIEGASSDNIVWDITNPINPLSIQSYFSGNSLRFISEADTTREFIIAAVNNFLSPAFVEKVENQNLHGLSTPKLLIISHPQFINQAIQLATYHANVNNLSVNVVTPQAIYNEFSSGSQDISAIRDFIRMLWRKAEPSDLPRYVLLFGDASYDYKNRVPKNTNFIPTYQSPESLHPVYSFATDDYFVSIDDNEGGNSSDVIDIGIGRLPVTTVEEAQMAVDKIIHYDGNPEKVHGDWRNYIAFVADDGDGNVHMSQADSLATIIDLEYRNYITDKIFLDAFAQESMAGGQRSPDANAAINRRVNKGALIINYTGHGGETGWTKEQILEVKDILEWSNYDRMPVFMTATCEFSRYDDPLRVSAGEHAFLNPKGGAIALFTTSRPTYGTPNFTLAINFYNTALKPINGVMPRLGDIIRISKAKSGAENNTKKFVLLGDPALSMAYPKLNVITTSINKRSITEESDTLKALQLVTIEGYVADNSKMLISEFNGTVTTTVFDKESIVETYGTEGGSPMTFTHRRNVIYKGKAKVVNGQFSTSFIVPRDIAYNFGPGKISYYATDGKVDAAGNYNNIIIGGISGQLSDYTGPEIKLFINDTTFKQGGFTDQNPVLFAKISDSSGINTVGNSIGHDIIAILDGDTRKPYILNDYYQSDVNTYKTGSITFPFFNLQPGRHTLNLIVWDVNNNFSEASTYFIVAPEDKVILSEIEAWPNPMYEEINFAVSHNQADKDIIANLTVYDMTGLMVASFKKNIITAGFYTTIHKWNGRGINGRRISPGMYIAKIRIETKNGLFADKTVKFIAR